ncbi:uncharacterized protein N7458_005868 [Penicillium daleae]|uniref:Uncharacterized protein n=1 Tax=Penicillium daleae TaxID=63821 RepID=A0AAD6C3N0_9EURO|nr:uncharacterized protein N7458_005868 [Penicillium daleae]KAJ5449419.1 hypothetical protein N7458_005868 [Penicillium daleae]
MTTKTEIHYRQTSLPLDSYVPTLRVVKEVVYLSWMSPMSKDTRCYHVQYAGLDSYWKGTHIESDAVYSGIFLQHNHLKLIVQLPKIHPVQQSDDPEMAGTLEIFESVVSGLQDYISSDGSVEPVSFDKDADSRRRSSICEVLLSTAVCMIIGEYQK